MDAELAALPAHRGDFNVLDLSRTRLMSKLGHRLGNMQYPSHMGLRKKPTVGIHRQFATDLNTSTLHKGTPFTFFAKAIILKGHQDRVGKTIIKLG